MKGPKSGSGTAKNRIQTKAGNAKRITPGKLKKSVSVEDDGSIWINALEALSTASESAVYIENLKSRQISWTGDVKRILGLNKKEGPETREEFNKLMHPDDYEKTAKLQNKILKSKDQYTTGYRIRLKNNKYQYVNETCVFIPGSKGMTGSIVGQISKVKPDFGLNDDSRNEGAEYGLVVNELPLFIYRINLKGEVTFSNKAYAELFNLSKDELKGKTAYDLHPKHLAAKYTSDDKNVFKNKKTFSTVEENINKITGKKEYFEVFKTPVYDEKGKVNGLVGVFWTVTNLVAIQKTLKNIESNYREIFNATGEAIFIHDTFGEILDVNSAATKMYGYTRDELLHLTLSELSSGDDYFNLETAQKKIKRSPEDDVETFEWHAKNKQGKLFWVEVSIRKSKIGGKGRVLAVVRDITKRKADEKALLLSQISINTSKDAVIWFDKEGKILFVNEAAFEMLGYSKKEIYALSICDIELNNARDLWGARLKNISSSGSLMTDSVFLDKKKNQIPVEITLGYYRYEKEEFVFSVVRNIAERKLAEEKLKESESKFRDMTELLPQGVYECDLTGKVTYANKKILELLQRTPDDIINGFNVADSLIPEERPEAVRHIRSILEGGNKNNQEYHMLRKDGTSFTVSIFSDIIKKKNKPVGLRGIIVDLTERIALENEKREHDNLFSLLFEKAGDANLLIEGDRFIDCNETTVKVLNADSKEEILQKHPWEISPEFQPDGMLSSVKGEMHIETAYNEGSSRFEWAHLKFDGSIFFAEVVLTAIPIKGKWYLHTSWRDITDKKNAEEKERIYYKRLEKLLEIERKILSAQSSEKIAQAALKHIREILDCHRASVILFDKENDLFTIIAMDSNIDTNAGIGDSYKLSENEIGNLKNGEVEVFNDLTEKKHLSALDRILLNEGIKSRISVPLMINNVPSGSLNLSSVNIGNFNDEKIKITQDVAVSISLALQHSNFISQINRQNLELEKIVDARTAQLKQTISELESFSYSVSHDLRAPLRSIGGFSQALIEDYSECLDDEGKTLLKRVVSASQKMSDLIDALLLLARITRSEMKFEDVNVSSLFVSIADEIQKYDCGRDAEFIIQSGLHTKGDQKLLKIAIENLLNNAWKFTRNRSRAVIEFGITNIDGENAYFIRDNGIGFDMAYVNKLFGAFQRLHTMEEFEGTGIGLATTKRIIQRHNGTIWAESKIDEGTTFYFTIKI